MDTKKFWSQQRDTYWLQSLGVNHKLLPKQSYTLEQDSFNNLFLKEYQKEFTFDYKLYGLETSLIDRVVKTANIVPGNLGILLNGLRGTGKTVTAKQMCNALNMPVIILDRFIEDGHRFINEIPEDIIVFIDEYEKIFEENHQLLSIMDGAMNSDYKRIFILTTNELYISENLIQRPGRIRYLKTFKDLSKNSIEEIVDDCLANSELKEKVISFISTLEMITIDVVKTLCQEVNIHGELPDDFEEVFNVKRVSGKFDIYVFDEKVGQPTTGMPIISNAKIYPYEEPEEDDSFEIDGDHIGVITEVFGDNLFKVNISNWTDSLNRSQIKLLGKDWKNYIVNNQVEEDNGIVSVGNSKAQSNRGRTKKRNDEKSYKIQASIVIQFERSASYHRMYRWPAY